jgi:hypothetical protein
MWRLCGAAARAVHYDEIVALHSLFCNLLADPKATAVDLRQFESALERGAAGGGGGRGGLPSSLFVHRVLSLFDTEGARCGSGGGGAHSRDAHGAARCWGHHI